MRPRVAIVAAPNGGEEDDLVRRIHGAVAGHAEVELLLAGEATAAFAAIERVRSFPVRASSRIRRRLLHAEFLHDLPDGFPGPSCRCTLAIQHEATGGVPEIVGREIARGEGGDSPELVETLSRETYDVVVFAGYRHAATVCGLDAVGAGARVVLVAMAADERLLRLSVYDEVFRRADAILAVTESEAELVAARAAGVGSARVTTIGFPVSVNPLAKQSEPVGFRPGREMVVSGDGVSTPGAHRNLECAWKALAALDADLVVDRPDHLERRDASGVQPMPRLARMDLWRWMVRGFAWLDPVPRRIVGRDVLEAMLCGIPAVVPESGGASREHVERANGGLWFRDDAELGVALRVLSEEPKLRESLGRQARAWVETTYGDSAAFASRVVAAVLDRSPMR